MGRKTPPYTNVQIHPKISVSLLIAFVAATVVIIAALCGSKSKLRGRKGSKGSKPSSVENDNDFDAPPTSTRPQERPPPPQESFQSPQSSPSAPPADEERNTGEDPEQSLPMFNFMSKENESLPKRLTVKTRRRLSTSLSMRAGGTALAKMLSRKEEPHMKKMPFFMMKGAIDYRHILLERHGHYQFLGPTHLLIEIKKRMYLVGYLCAKNENPQNALIGCIYLSDF